MASRTSRFAATSKHMIEEQAKKQTKPREWKTKLINALFEADGKGGYVMKPSKAVFESHKEAYHKRYGTDEKEGMQKTVFLYKVFHGNEQGLERAIQEGGVVQWIEDGLEMCAFRRVSAGVEKSALQAHKVSSGGTWGRTEETPATPPPPPSTNLVR